MDLFKVLVHSRKMAWIVWIIAGVEEQMQAVESR